MPPAMPKTPDRNDVPSITRQSKSIISGVTAASLATLL